MYAWEVEARSRDQEVTVSKVWIFKTNYADPTFRVEFAGHSGMMPVNLHFNDVHELRHFLDSRRLPGAIHTEQILHRLAIAGHVELDVAEPTFA
jgi:hypothetical protein